jgi:hypothetical protein
VATLDDLKKVAEKKKGECKIKAVACSLSLNALFPANLILFVGAALLSLLAGASILTDSNVISTTTAGIMALISSGLTLIHSKLGCDQYQAECKKLAGFYNGIAEDNANLSLIDDAEELKKKFIALNNELSTPIKTAGAKPFDWAIDKAIKQSMH